LTKNVNRAIYLRLSAISNTTLDKIAKTWLCRTGLRVTSAPFPSTTQTR